VEIFLFGRAEPHCLGSWRVVLRMVEFSEFPPVKDLAL